MKKHTLNKYLFLKKCNKRYYLNFLYKYKMNKLFCYIIKNYMNNFTNKANVSKGKGVSFTDYFRVDILEKPAVFRRKTKYCRYFFFRQFFRSFYGALKIHYLKQLAKRCFYSKQAPLYFLRSLESRLDVFLYRLGLVRSAIAAKQIIAHGNVLVNSKVVRDVSYELKVNDIVSFIPSKIHEYKRQVYLNYKNATVLHSVFASYVEVDFKHFIFTMGTFKKITEVYFPFRLTEASVLFIMNFYTKEWF